MESFLKNRFWQWAVLFIIIKLCLHLFTYNNYELHRDEMLYFNQGDHLSLGNATVPPFIGWIAFLVKAVFGYSVFGIRLLPAVSGAFTVVIIAKAVKEMGG